MILQDDGEETFAPYVYTFLGHVRNLQADELLLDMDVFVHPYNRRPEASNKIGRITRPIPRH